MSIFDLDVITDTLPQSPSIFIHYLKERINSLNEDVFQLSDELSAFSWYLENLSIRRPGGDDYLNVNYISLDTDFIRSFDDYYLRKGGKPKINLEDDWICLIQFIEVSNWLHHTEMCEKLLTISIDIRKELIERIKKLESRKRGKEEIDLISLTTHSHEIGISYLTSEGDRNDLIHSLQSICEIRKYQSKKDTWIGLAKIRRPNEPWWKTTAVHLLSYPWKFEPKMEKLSKDFPFKKP